MKILQFIYKFGTNAWVNIFVSILLFSLLTFFLYDFQDFHYQSYFLGCGYFISVSLFDYGFQRLIVRLRKK